MSNFFRWHGTGPSPTAFDDGRNWADSEGVTYDQARYPGSLAGVEDAVYFDAPLVLGAGNPAGFDGTALETLSEVVVGPAFTGVIGSDAAPLTFKCRYVRYNSFAAGAAYIELVNIAGYAKVLVTNAVNLNLAGVFELDLYRGNVRISAGINVSTAVARLFVGYVTAKDNDASLTIDPDVVVNTMVHQNGGQVECLSVLNASDPLGGGYNLYQAGGVWTQRAGMNAYRGVGGTLQWIDGNIGDLYIDGASVDASAGPNPRFCSTAKVTANGSLNLNNGLGNIRIRHYVQQDSGSIVLPEGKRFRPSPMGEEAVTKEFVPPHVGNSGSNSTVSTGYVFVGPNDLLELTAMSDAGSGEWSAVLRAASDDAGTDEEGAVSFLELRPEKLTESYAGVIQSRVFGSDLPDGKPYVKALMSHLAATDTTIAAILTLRKF